MSRSRRFVPPSRGTSRPARRTTRFLPAFQPLESRKVPAVTAVFNPGAGTLSVLGDGAANEIVIGRDALGVITVNGEIPLAGGGVFYAPAAGFSGSISTRRSKPYA